VRHVLEVVKLPERDRCFVVSEDHVHLSVEAILNRPMAADNGPPLVR
jgi:hypothetical protein